MQKLDMGNVSLVLIQMEVLIMFNSLQEFVDYVWSFYNPQSDLYPIKGLTKKDIFDAFNVYVRRIESNSNEYYTWGEGDSLDRERVRDIILEQPQFTWSS